MDGMKCVDNMVINITDICNMSCPFCLRGEGHSRKLDLSLIPRIFDGIHCIHSITISGGDPSCYVKAVTAIVDYLVSKKDEIEVDGFYIITNGKTYRQELVDAVKRMLYLYIERNFKEKQISHKDIKNQDYDGNEIFWEFGLAVSLDMYHEPIDTVNYFKYRTSGVYSASKEVDFSGGRGVIARGYGTGIAGSSERGYSEFDVYTENGSICADTAYVSVTGMVFGDCDMSYEMENEIEPAGDLRKETLAGIIKRHAE